MSNIDKLKPGKYAVLFRNNWDGEGDTYETFATLDAEGVWRDEDGDELLEYQGDEVLKAWPLDDGSDVLALLGELEAKDSRLNEILKPNMLLPVIDDMDEDNLRHVIKTVCENYSLLHAKWEAAGNRTEAAEKRIAELESREVKLPERYEVEMCPTPSPEGDWYSREDVLAALKAAGIKFVAGTGNILKA